ncbi:MAG TPA: ATP-grasp domain-containing protein [Tepidisphaeraceae bacterium]|nr:ATP-grasp domain-containing protein [Tepidisphaeraceae bacterium]
MPKNLLLFAATTGYQIRTFADAVRAVGAELTFATDRCHVLDDPWGDHALAVKFDRIAESVEGLRGRRFDGIVAVGDRPAVLAAEAAVALGLPFHTPTGARAAHDKHLARSLFGGQLRAPRFFQTADPDDAAQAPYPCVLKPLGLSASRGVIRANNPAEFRAAFARIRKMGEDRIQVESYIPGREFAVEGLVTNGRFQALAIFDKPDPMEGPYFEETIYTTPSRASESVQRELLDTTARAVEVLGLRHGPVHVELRYNDEGAWVLEAHARPIGGLCANTLRFDGGMTLEELIVRHALGEDVAAVRREQKAAGVMMIPVPRGGIYHGVDGVERAAAVAGIEDVIVTAKEGQALIPLPEGSTYMGFIFARADSPEEVESALRDSHAELRFEVATALETFSPSS